MYYILSQTQQIIAADENFLSYCNVENINELSVEISKGTIELGLHSDDGITIRKENNEENFMMNKTALSSLLGQLTLIHVSIPESTSLSDLSSTLNDESNIIIDDIIKEENTEDLLMDNLLLDSADTFEDENKEADLSTLQLTDDNLMDLKDENAESTGEISSSEQVEFPEDDALFDLGLDNISTTQESDDIIVDPNQEDLSEIYIDSESISAKIGISNDDYKNFLNDFIDTALSLEKDLQSQNDNIRNDAINTLSHLSDVLHLEVVSDIISNIKNNDTKRADIEAFYSTLSRITTQNNTLNNTLETKVDENTKDTNETLELFDEPVQAPEIDKAVTAKKKPSAKSFGSISLKDVKAKHFDFQLEEAANDLSLPVELIEEFVHDFIEQAHIETKKMLQAYEEGDLETIQKIGHLLKGASSNLRINPLSDTLYKIQFCENSNDLEKLIKDYWAHFLSFETQINAISH